MKNELKRKIIHISTVLFPVLYFFKEKKQILFILGLLIVFAISVELCRFFNLRCTKLFDRVVGDLLRLHEKEKFTSATNLLLAFYVSVFIFSKPVAITCMFFVSLSDAFSALAGKKWGKKRIFKDKTLLGCSVFAATGLIIILIIPGMPFNAGLAGLIAAILVDVLMNKIDDNITISIISGLVMQLVLFL